MQSLILKRVAHKFLELLDDAAIHFKVGGSEQPLTVIGAGLLGREEVHKTVTVS
jgi:hypothetical protein